MNLDSSSRIFIWSTWGVLPSKKSLFTLHQPTERRDAWALEMSWRRRRIVRIVLTTGVMIERTYLRRVLMMIWWMRRVLTCNTRDYWPMLSRSWAQHCAVNNTIVIVIWGSVLLFPVLFAINKYLQPESRVDQCCENHDHDLHNNERWRCQCLGLFTFARKGFRLLVIIVNCDTVFGLSRILLL